MPPASSGDRTARAYRFAQWRKTMKGIRQPEFRLHVTDDDRVVWRHEESGRLLPIVSGGDGEETTTDAESTGREVEIPDDLSTLDDNQLDELITAAETAVREMADNPSPSSDEVVAVQQLNAATKGMKADRTRRQSEAAQRLEDFNAAVADALAEQDASDTGEGGDGDEGEGDATGEGGDDEPEPEPEATETTAASSATPAKPVKVRISGVGAEGTRRSASKLNLNMADLKARAPDPGVQNGQGLRVTAAGDIPHFRSGQELETLDDVVKAAIARVKSLGVSQGNAPFVPLCTIEREFPLTFGEQMTSDQVDEAWHGYLAEINANTAGGMEALVAAGGWCAPSQIDYSFFNIAAVSGLLDLPTFGVTRGGLRHPANGGLSLHDFFALSGAPASGLPTNATMPWQWTEADDVAATGGTPTKLCMRPPCPTFVDDRLVAYGICVLAGNLTAEAYPELIRDFIAKTVVAHARAMNRRHILAVVAASTATTPTSTGSSAVNAALGGLDLNAVDYREKHGMSEDAVLEVVAPAWIRGVWRSDLAKKNGLDRLDAADAYLADLWNTRNIRMQYVQDWQTRGAAAAGSLAPSDGSIPTNWPATAQTVMFAPGSFGRGNGPTLDLGVVRDSVLNKANDHSAAWSEESTLVAKMGHESRVITLPTVANGNTGDQVASTGA